MKIFNTLSRRKEEFVPLTPGEVKMYVCGPTVYNLIHIGNARPMIVFDTVRRYFEYKGYDVSGRADLDEFPDGEDTSAWAEGTMGWAVAEGLISGGDNNALMPGGSAIRAQAASILMNFDKGFAQEG